MSKLQNIYKVTYQITDRGEKFCKVTEEVSGNNPEQKLRKHIKKYSHAMDLSKNYKIKIIKTVLVGFGFG